MLHPPVSLTRFSEEEYLLHNPDLAIGLSTFDSIEPATHFIHFGIDEGRELNNQPRRHLDSYVDALMVSSSGFCFFKAWSVADSADLAVTISNGHLSVELDRDWLVAHERADVRAAIPEAGVGSGCLCLFHLPSRNSLNAAVSVTLSSGGRTMEHTVQATPVTDKMLLDAVLSAIEEISHEPGGQLVLSAIERSNFSATIDGLVAAMVKNGSVNSVESYGPEKLLGPSFITVLFGDVSAIKTQVAIFSVAGISFKEWIFVNNSPELSAAASRLARLSALLYGQRIVLVHMGHNVGFGSANNAAVELATTDNIVLINPDVFPLLDDSECINEALSVTQTSTLRGALLFYDANVLMHGGMHFEFDNIYIDQGLQSFRTTRPVSQQLVRVEHWDKGVPFQTQKWTDSRAVEAVTGAVMAFDRGSFERLGGFSGEYIFGHYEDADLSLRWGREIGAVEVDPRLRLIHQEGQGSSSSGPIYKGAAKLNRHRFHNKFFSQDER